MNRKEIEGKSICFTGKLNNFTRNQARAMAVSVGMTIAESVSACLDYLVMADPNSTSNKARKARSYGVTLISEDAFMEMMNLNKVEVEAETEYKKTHKEKKILDWKTCFDIIAKKLNISAKKKTYPYYSNGKDEKTVELSLYFDDTFFLGRASDILTVNKYDGSDVVWNEDDQYDATDDDAYKKAVWLIGVKRFLGGAWAWDRAACSKVKKMVDSYPEFGMPGSTEELKLKLEILDWSII